MIICFLYTGNERLRNVGKRGKRCKEFLRLVSCKLFFKRRQASFGLTKQNHVKWNSKKIKSKKNFFLKRPKHYPDPCQLLVG